LGRGRRERSRREEGKRREKRKGYMVMRKIVRKKPIRYRARKTPRSIGCETPSRVDDRKRWASSSKFPSVDSIGLPCIDEGIMRLKKERIVGAISWRLTSPFKRVEGEKRSFPFCPSFRIAIVDRRSGFPLFVPIRERKRKRSPFS
jgi:hypothetical protein